MSNIIEMGRGRYTKKKRSKLLKFLKSRRRRHSEMNPEMKKKFNAVVKTFVASMKPTRQTKKTAKSKIPAALRGLMSESNYEKMQEELKKKNEEKAAAMKNNGNVNVRRSSRTRKAVERFNESKYNRGGESSRPGEVRNQLPNRKQQVREERQTKLAMQTIKAREAKREAEVEKQSSRGVTRKSHGTHKSKGKSMSAAQAAAVVAAQAAPRLSVVPEKSVNENNARLERLLNKSNYPAGTEVPENIIERMKRLGL